MEIDVPLIQYVENMLREKYWGNVDEFFLSLDDIKKEQLLSQTTHSSFSFFYSELTHASVPLHNVEHIKYTTLEKTTVTTIYSKSGILEFSPYIFITIKEKNNDQKTIDIWIKSYHSFFH